MYQVYLPRVNGFSAAIPVSPKPWCGVCFGNFSLHDQFEICPKMALRAQMAYALVQTRNRPDMALPAANKALHVITESNGGQRTMDLACARAVVAASMHASGDCAGAIKEYKSVMFWQPCIEAVIMHVCLGRHWMSSTFCNWWTSIRLLKLPQRFRVLEQSHSPAVGCLTWSPV